MLSCCFSICFPSDCSSANLRSPLASVSQIWPWNSVHFPLQRDRWHGVGAGRDSPSLSLGKTRANRTGVPAWPGSPRLALPPPQLVPNHSGWVRPWLPLLVTVPGGESFLPDHCANQLNPAKWHLINLGSLRKYLVVILCLCDSKYSDRRWSIIKLLIFSRICIFDLTLFWGNPLRDVFLQSNHKCSCKHMPLSVPLSDLTPSDKQA